ncbi:hypothetical protein [Methylophilus methylotrophus]|uniref:hypothetical protein n=1 Tax=Methylophilus methylotrophus TaxID=17 RepID=UPI0003657E7A|nr:hypothetical protein [Methylophilus methylotrophus]
MNIKSLYHHLTKLSDFYKNAILLTSMSIFAIWVINIQHGWITNDSILYFEMAKHIANGDFQAAYDVEKFSWGFYPALIALVHKITGLGLHASANLLIVGFFVGLVGGLMRLVQIAGGSWREQYLAVCLLLGARYMVGDIMPMVSRDLGYWTTMLWAVNFLVLYYQKAKLAHAFYWQGFALIALLFRIEGAVQLLALPLFGLCFTTQARTWCQRLMPYALVLLGAFILATMLIAKGESLDNLGRMKELFTGLSDIQSNFSQNLSHRVEIMRNDVIGEPFKEYAWFTFLLAYLAIVTIKCLSVAGWAPTLLSVTQFNRIKSVCEPITTRFILWCMLLSWATGCLIAFKVNLLSGRYVGLFGIALITLGSFALSALLNQLSACKLSKKSKSLLVFVTGLIVIGFIGSVAPKKQSYYFEIDAVRYVKQKIKPNESVLYSSPRQRFYADAPYEGRYYDEWEYIQTRIQDGRINQFNHLVIHLDATPENQSKEHYLATHLSQFKLDKTFYGHKNKKRILVFKKVVE